MTTTAKAGAVGKRLPYLLAKLKAPRVLERLEQTAARAREEGWPYEQFLEALLEVEVFARDASGARQRIRHAAFSNTATSASSGRPAPARHTSRSPSRSKPASTDTASSSPP